MNFVVVVKSKVNQVVQGVKDVVGKNFFNNIMVMNSFLGDVQGVVEEVFFGFKCCIDGFFGKDKVYNFIIL